MDPKITQVKHDDQSNPQPTDKTQQLAKQQQQQDESIKQKNGKTILQQFLHEQKQLDEALIFKSIPLCIYDYYGRDIKFEFGQSQSLLEARFVLSDCVKTCFHTTYDLVNQKGETLNELDGLLQCLNPEQIENIKSAKQFSQIKLFMKPKEYSERDVRNHIKRFQELLFFPPLGNEAMSQDANQRSRQQEVLKKLEELRNSEARGAKTEEEIMKIYQAERKAQEAFPQTDSQKAMLDYFQKFRKIDNFQPIETVLLSSYFQTPTGCGIDLKPPIRCIRSLDFSQFNPIPQHRLLRGDLLYLKIQTLQGSLLQITACTKGFYINNSFQPQHFDPSPSTSQNPCFSHTIAQLLSKNSAKFQTNFRKHLSTGKFIDQRLHASPQALVPRWLIRHSQAIHSSHSSSVPQTISNFEQDSTSYHIAFIPQGYIPQHDDLAQGLYGLDPKGIRDWNQQYQLCKNIPSSSPETEIQRDRALTKIYTQFSKAAIKAGKSIVHGNIVGLNPYQQSSQQKVYLYNNIFFSYARDDYLNFRHVVQEQNPTYMAINYDIIAINKVNEFNIKGVNTIMSLVIDYLGCRIIAQSMIPGILHAEEHNKTTIYGSLDEGSFIRKDQKVHELFKQINQKLRVKECDLIQINDGAVVKISGCRDTKGIAGTDGRSYLLDMHRFTPRDLNYDSKVGPQQIEDDDDEQKKQDDKKIPKQQLLMRQFNSLITGQTQQQKAGLEKVQKLARSLPAHGMNLGAVVRPELLQLFHKKKVLKLAKQKQTKYLMQEHQRKKQEDKQQSKSEQQGLTQAQQQEQKLNQRLKLKTKFYELHKESENQIKRIDYNINLFTHIKTHYDNEQQKQQDIANIRELSKFIIDTQIPQFINAIQTQERVIYDSESLSEILHSFGINVRYLGKIADIMTKQGKTIYAKVIIERSIFVRCVKHIVNKYIRGLDKQFMSVTAAHLLNIILSPQFLLDKLNSGKIVFDVKDKLYSSSSKLPGHVYQNAEGQQEQQVKSQKDGGDYQQAGYKKGGHQNQQKQSKKQKRKNNNNNNVQTVASTTNTVTPSSTSSENNASDSKNQTQTSTTFFLQSSKVAEEYNIDPLFGGSSQNSTANLFMNQEQPHKLPQALLLRPQQIWDEITECAFKHFNYILPAKQYQFIPLKNSTSRMPTLRQICLKLGIQIINQNYKYFCDSQQEDDKQSAKGDYCYSDLPFNQTDIIGFSPIIKTMSIGERECKSFMKTARQQYQLNKPNESMNTYRMCVQCLNQIFGPYNPYIGECYEHIATIHSVYNDNINALTIQDKALLIYQKCLGFDHYRTIRAIKCMVEYVMRVNTPDNVQQTLGYLNRAIYLVRIVSGDLHPDLVWLYRRLALLHYYMRKLPRALDLFLEAADLYIIMFGKQSHFISQCYRYISMCYFELDDERNYEKHKNLALDMLFKVTKDQNKVNELKRVFQAIQYPKKHGGEIQKLLGDKIPQAEREKIEEAMGFQLPRTRPFGQNRANNRAPPRLSEQLSMRAAAAQLKKLRKIQEKEKVQQKKKEEEQDAKQKKS